MRNRLNRRVAAAAGAGISLTLMLAACGADQIEGSGSSGGESGEAAGSGTGVDPAAEIDCAPYEEFGDIEGTEVSLYTSILAPEDQPYIDAFAPFTECTGVDVTYEGSSEFEAQLLVRTQAGNPPDIALFPQPGLLQTIVRDTGTVVPAPDQVEAAVDEYYGEDWKDYGTVDGEFYAAPNSRERQVLRLVLAVRLRGGRLRGPRDLGRHARPVRPDRRGQPRRRGQALVRGHRAPVTPPAGPRPTGWRTSCSAPRGRTSTTSGSTTRSPSTTRPWPRRSSRSAASSRTRSTSTAASAACSPSPPPGLPGRRPADPRRQLLHAPPGVVLRRQLARGHRGGRGRRRLRVLPAPDQRGVRQPGPGCRRVRRRVLRRAPGAGVPAVHDVPGLHQQPRQGRPVHPAALRPGHRQPDRTRSTSCRPSCSTTPRRRSASTPPT